MPIAFIAVGSNLDDRLLNMHKAESLLIKSNKVKLVHQSAVFETVPAGGPPQGFFLNAVWKVETGFSPQELLKELNQIELKLGRMRLVKNGPRTIDLDILDYDGLILESSDLTLPHPRIPEREFVLRPLHDLDSGWTHPVLKKSVTQLWAELKLRTKSNEAN